MLALGAAIGTSAYFIKFLAISLFGIRTPTVSKPPATTEGTASVLLRIIVNGPGQKAFINLNSTSEISFAILPSISISEICKINGLSELRPLAA